MYHQNVRCTSCHSPHTGKLKAEGSKVCLQCHAPKYASQAHTFHKGNTAETDCRVCHMPTRTYMGNDVRHDHNFYVPRPDLSAQYGTPNACNACHTDKTARWAAEAVTKWYGKQRKPHFAENLIKGSKGNIAALSSLLEDKTTPAIVRAGAIHYLGNHPSEKSFALIKKELHSPDPQTRYRAVVAISEYPLNLYEGFEQAHQEYKDFVLSQSDFPLGSATAGDYFVKINDTDNAIRFYERALLKDKQLNYIRLNLAVLYSGKAQNDKAENFLNEALKYEPKNAQIYYDLYLLYNELGREAEAKVALSKAKALGIKGRF